ncbi:MAG: retroviral-like aspartic protease family protein [Alphaproteobacteria bacterium]
MNTKLLRNILLPLGIASCAPTLLPMSATPSPTSEQGSVTINESGWGFRLAAKANGVPFKFLVDTGANLTAFSWDDALKLGAKLQDDSFDNSTGELANGIQVSSEPFMLASLQIAPGCLLTNVMSIALKEPMPEPLLGVSALDKVDVHISQGKMVLSCKGAQPVRPSGAATNAAPSPVTGG